ncbi:MAG: hypothetical protein HZA93_26720 [Verrucomicrobia bacterium]|nr:hypothetical protein [Verrucomicrobiota bacterium]
MRFFTFPALLAAALVSAVVALPFLPIAKTQTDFFAFEVRMTSKVTGVVKIYFDAGAGFSETATSQSSAVAGQTATHRLALPAGSYRAIRFDPIDREGTVTVESLRIVSRRGRVVRDLRFAEFAPANQIQSLREMGGKLEIASTPGANDPHVVATFNPPLAVRAGNRELLGGLAPITLGIFAGLAALLLALDRLPALRAALAATASSLLACPGRAVAVVAALAVVASTYPVIFLGKSHVSPNLGTILLYDAFPTLPGYKDPAMADVKGSDIGAVMWSHIPLSHIQRRALGQGELPLWNRYNSTGTPALGQGQSMFGDPLHFLVIAANGTAWAWDLKYLIAKWLFATGLGLLVFAIARHVPSALIIAAAAPFVGFFYYRLNHPAFFSLCYAPWALYAWVRVAQAADRRSVALWAAALMVANLALMNSGTAKEAYMLLLTMNFSGFCVLLASDAPWRARLAKAAALAWAGGLFVLLTAPIWATFLNTLKSSYTGYNAASAFQIQPSLLLGAFDEIFYRPVMTEERTFNPSVNFVILLGLLYLLATLRHHFANRAALALAVSALVPLALAFGLVPAAWIVQLPFLSNVAHVDNTFTCALIVLWSVLAGVGFAHAARRLGTPEARGDLIAAGLLLFALVFAWVAFRQTVHRQIFGAGSAFTTLNPGQVMPVSPFVWGDLAVLLVAAIFTAWAVRRALVRQSLSPALGLLLALAALTMIWRTGLHAESVGFSNYVHHPKPRVDFHAKSPAVEWLRTAQEREPGRGFGLRGNFFAGWTAVYGLETVHGPDALVNPWLRELVSASGIERLWDWRLYVEPTNVSAARPFLDALNVRWYLDLASDQGLLGRQLRLLKVADLDIYESPTAWPRAFFTNRLDVYDQPAELVAKIKTADGKPFAAAQRTDFASQPALAPVPRGFADRTVVGATNYRLTENTTSFTVRTTGPGVIVLGEAWWPGDFRAELNGRKVPLVRVNHAFKGVVVDSAGDNHVTIRCVPKNWPRHLALAGLGALLLAGSLWLALRPARRA